MRSEATILYDQLLFGDSLRSSLSLTPLVAEPLEPVPPPVESALPLAPSQQPPVERVAEQPVAPGAPGTVGPIEPAPVTGL